MSAKPAPELEILYSDGRKERYRRVADRAKLTAVIERAEEAERKLAEKEERSVENARTWEAEIHGERLRTMQYADALEVLLQTVEEEWPNLRVPEKMQHARAMPSQVGTRLRRAAEKARKDIQHG